MKTYENFYFRLFNPEYRLVLGFILAGVLNLYAIPVMIRVAKKINLFALPNGRTSHERATPTLGGIGIYFSITLVSLLLINSYGLNGRSVVSSMTSLPSIIAGSTLIFFVGLKDDVMNISAWKKLTAEIFAMLMLIIAGDVRLSNMEGMFGIYELNYFVSIGLSLFAGIVIINSFNLIDGIDGLAASIAMLASTVFGIYFILIKEWEFSIFSFIIVGSLIPFFAFNVFGKSYKIFMGDTGSLLLGFALTVLVFRFNKMNSIPSTKPLLIAGPAFSFSVILVPMFDTLRVFAIRIYRGGSPFRADRRHIHHVLLNLGLTHLQATSLLTVITLIFVVFAYKFNYLGNSMLVFLMLGFSSVLMAIAMKLNRMKLQNKRRKKSIKLDTVN